MKIEAKYKTTTNIVKAMREIRDEINFEIQDLTFEEERAYLNQLLASKVNNENKTRVSGQKQEIKN